MEHFSITTRQELDGQLHRFLVQCTNSRCGASLAYEGLRPRVTMCPACGSSTAPLVAVEMKDHTPRMEVGGGLAIIGGHGGPDHFHNLPHSRWISIVDRITRRWLLAEIAYQDTCHGSHNEAFASINRERASHGLKGLSWEDVSDEAEKL